MMDVGILQLYIPPVFFLASIVFFNGVTLFGSTCWVEPRLRSYSLELDFPSFCCISSKRGTIFPPISTFSQNMSEGLTHSPNAPLQGSVHDQVLFRFRVLGDANDLIGVSFIMTIHARLNHEYSPFC